MPPFAIAEERFEDVSVLAVVESPHELIEVAGELLARMGVGEPEVDQARIKEDLCLMRLAFRFLCH
jgi:hypothetical protein